MKLKIDFLGGAREVGRSAVLVSFGNKRILLDYGSTPSARPRFPKRISPDAIDAVILSHCHIDHSGMIPYLFMGGRPRLIATGITLEFTYLLLRDFYKLNGKYLPWDLSDLERTMKLAQPYSYDLTFYINGIYVKMLNAGHVPGSASILLEENGIKVWYTGDVNMIETHLIEPMDVPESADIIICEATYGNRDHPPRHTEEMRLVKAVKEVVDEGGTVLIPAFSVGRAQEIVCILREYGYTGKIWMDGMAQQATFILLAFPEFTKDYARVRWYMKSAKYVVSNRQRKKIVKKPGVIIAPAGMLEGGWAWYYLMHIYSKEKNGIFFVSYQAENTKGRYILENRKLPPLLGNKEIKARIEYFELSSHSGRQQLLDMIKKINSIQKIFVVHADNDVAVEFAEKLREMGFDSFAPEFGEHFILKK